jgi:hypothetical protein
MTDWDKKLEEAIKSLKGARPTDLEIHKWKKAAFKEVRANRSQFTFIQKPLRFAAAGFIGFAIGWVVFGSGLIFQSRNDFLANSNDNATVEFIFTN